MPLVPATARTMHHVQGATLDEYVVDWKDTARHRTAGLGYTTISRVTSLQKTWFVDEFDPESFLVSMQVKAEMDRLERERPFTSCIVQPNRPATDVLMAAVNV